MSDKNTNKAVNEILESLTSGGFDPAPIESTLDAIAENTSNTVSALADVNAKLDTQSSTLTSIASSNANIETSNDDILTELGAQTVIMGDTQNSIGNMESTTDDINQKSRTEYQQALCTDTNGEYFWEIKTYHIGTDNYVLDYVDKSGVTVVPDMPTLEYVDSLIYTSPSTSISFLLFSRSIHVVVYI